MSGREIWKQAYRAARGIPCTTTANTTALEVYPYEVRRLAIAAAWCGHHRDALNTPMFIRAHLHRAGNNLTYTLFGTCSPDVRLPA